MLGVTCIWKGPALQSNMSSVTCLHTPTKKPKIVNVVLLDGSEYPVYVDVSIFVIHY